MLVLDSFMEDVFPAMQKRIKEQYGSSIILKGNKLYVEKKSNITSEDIIKYIEQGYKQIGVFF